MSLDIYLHVAACSSCGRGEECVYSTNITHNLNKMWQVCEVYTSLYESQDLRAKDILPQLKKGLQYLLDHPKECKEYDAANGWGTYEDAVPFLKELIEACKQFPNAKIEISR